jgi:hypothetical protein
MLCIFPAILCYTVQIPESFWQHYREHASEIALFEDGSLLHSEAKHADIRKLRAWSLLCGTASFTWPRPMPRIQFGMGGTIPR